MEKVECPVCGKCFNKSVISEHVNLCLSHNDADSTDTDSNAKKQEKQESKKRKNTDWSFLSMEKRSQPKSTKSDHLNMSSAVKSATNDQETVTSRSSKTVQSENLMGLNRKSNNLKFQSVNNIPLAEKMRPQNFDNFIGQEQSIGKESLLFRVLSHGDHVPSLILHGPPGCGKTTFAKIIAHNLKSKHNIKFVTMSATTCSVNDVKEVAKIAGNDIKMFQRKTVLFLDEIHRFNKTQQDTLLPFVEDGTLTLIGATTENPSFNVNSALLSRCRVITFEKLTIDNVKMIISRALKTLGISVIPSGESKCRAVVESSDSKALAINIEEEALDVLAGLVDGDARAALNGLQLAIEGYSVREHQSPNAAATITPSQIKEALQRTHVLYDKSGEEHYNTVSALIKSMRGSDASAALYWMTRMLEGGENPLFIARRLVIFASEDIGLADPLALNLAVATHQACHIIGVPECSLNLAHCVIYLARAPKSALVLQALQAARKCVQNHQGALPPVPLHLRNASNKFLKNAGYGKGYKYPPAFSEPVDQAYFPSSLAGTDFFNTPTS
ncbi:Werner helicase interacting protein 1 [Bulinus truncatus]|nr:Werner helicase interacting protein 1 [Bulinus truncatus]